MNTELEFGQVPSGPVSIPVYYDASNSVLYVTDDVSEWDAVRNVANYTSDDQHDSEAEDDDAANLGVLIKALRNTDPAELLKSILGRYLPDQKPDVLKGKSFMVTLDESGRVELVSQA